jgi:hypothetical protein
MARNRNQEKSFLFNFRTITMYFISQDRKVGVIINLFLFLHQTRHSNLDLDFGSHLKLLQRNNLAEMHSCLTIVDILEEICFHVGQRTGLLSTISGRKDLLAMAQACRQFYDPAISSLWHTLEGLFLVIG